MASTLRIYVILYGNENTHVNLKHWSRRYKTIRLLFSWIEWKSYY